MWGGGGRRRGLTSLTLRGRTTPPPPAPLGPEAERPPPQGHTEPPPPPPKAPRTATPSERAELAEPAAGRGQRGALHEWVEQQQQLQRAGAWEARAISAEAANRDLEARLSRANGGRAGRRIPVGGRHQGGGPPGHQGESPVARPGDGAQGKATGTGRGGA